MPAKPTKRQHVKRTVREDALGFTVERIYRAPDAVWKQCQLLALATILGISLVPQAARQGAA